MKALSMSLLLLVLVVLPEQVSAQLLPDQRTFDFQNLVALYAKRYAPYDWKRRALGFDLFDIQPWLDRVRAAKNDLEFFEIEAEYVGNLNDTHSGFSMTSSFRANLGITVDIYDGKVLIDSINRSILPATNYPFQIGDELVSVDSVSVEDWINRISVWRRWGNPISTRRVAAGQITFRSQSTFPRAVEIGDFAAVTIRRANGNLEDYTIPWRKTGIPVFSVGPVPIPKAPNVSMASSTREPSGVDPLEELHQYRLPENDLVLAPIPWAKDENGVQRTYVNGIGSLVPIFRAGFPTNFIQRLGRLPSEFHYSGTYLADGLTLGYLRFPNFAPPNLSDAVRELRDEIQYLESNTDGLVIDVTRNPGGGCYMIDAAAALIPYAFYFFGEEIRATQDRLNALQTQLENAQSTGAEQSVIDTYQSYVDQLKAALAANRGMTAPIAACRQFGSTGAPIIHGNQPAPVVYTKPIIVLIDEFSISAADIFPAMIQDNARALLVGARTSGGGGSVSGWPTGFYSESISNNTNTLVVRRSAIETAEYPTAPYVENIGARPDIPLDLMTRENLLTGGRAYVNQFTEILLDEIRTTISSQLNSQSLLKKSN
jgi:C-terminal processing protease CtpA/Prc